MNLGVCIGSSLATSSSSLMLSSFSSSHPCNLTGFSKRPTLGGGGFEEKGRLLEMICIFISGFAPKSILPADGIEGFSNKFCLISVVAHSSMCVALSPNTYSVLVQKLVFGFI